MFCQTLRFTCIIAERPDLDPFPVETRSWDTVACLKDLIWHAEPKVFEDIGPQALELWWIQHAQRGMKGLDFEQGLGDFMSLAEHGYVYAASPSTMTRRSSQLITLFCIIDGQPSSSAFCIKISNGFTVDDLKTSIKTKQSQLAFFKSIEAINLRLWRVLIDEASHCDKVVLLSDVSGMEKRLLMSTDRLSAIFSRPPSDGYIHIVIENTGNGPECQRYQDEAPDRASTPNSAELCTVVINARQRDFIPPAKSSNSGQVGQQFPREISTVMKSETGPPEDKSPQDVNFCAQDPVPGPAAVIFSETSKHDQSVNSTATGMASHQSEQGTPDPSDAVVARTPKLKRTFSFMEEDTGNTPEQDIILCSSRPASFTKRVCFPPQTDRHDHSVDSATADEASDHNEQVTLESSNHAAARKLRRIIAFMDGDSGSPLEQYSTSSSTEKICFTDQERRERLHWIHQAQDAIRRLNKDKTRATLDLLQNSIQLFGPAREQASHSMLEDLEKTAKVLRRHLRDLNDRIAKVNKWLQHAEDLDS
ncbi:unnamed protein product [Mortierella alpina]